MTDNANRFECLVREAGTFVITCEHIPGRVSHDRKLDDIIAFAEKSRETGLVHAITLNDNPGGTPAISPDILALEIEKVGFPAIVHFTTKDMNRNMVDSRALLLDRMGIGNLLVMSGDYPTAGQFGLPMPVFDLDPVHAITLLTLMNKGWCICHETNKLEKGPRTNFFIGAVVSPFKYTEAEFMPQMYKMEMKVKAGARYFVTQLGFDARKLKDLKRSLGEAEINIPVIGSVFILRKSTAALMNRGSIPGTHVTDELLTLITKEAEADDRGIAGSLERAAMQVAVLKGLGFKGAHLEAMVMKFDMVETILGRAKELADTWEECAEKLSFSPKGSFYLGENDVFAQSQASRKVKNGWFLYRIMRIVHDLFFVKTGFSGTIMRFFSRILERVKSLGVLSHWFERYLKLILFDCCDCGDCALPELHYLCPQSQCPKQQRNGPCGGSHLDGCEVYPDRPCVWTRVYVRAKAFRELDTMRSTVIGPLNWKLQKTSAWVNYHLGYDHTSYDFRTYFTVPERKE